MIPSMMLWIVCALSPVPREPATLTDTRLAQGLTGNPQMASAIAQLHPLPRLGRAEDSAHLAAFLLSDRADWITGQVIGVDGGRGRLRPKG